MKKLDVLGLPIVDHCNLNCKGCYHFCTRGQAESLVPYADLEKDLIRMKQLVDHVDWIKLYGGEPLLHPQLSEIVRLVRATYPYAEICLMTNGLLVTAMDGELVNILRDADVKVDITVYPAVEKGLPKIVEFLEKNSLRSQISHVSQFGKRFNKKGNSDIISTYQACDMKICHYLQYGEFVMCPLPIFIRRYNQLFGSAYHFDDDILHIHDPKVTYEDIIQFSNRPHDCCRYCSETETFDWEIGALNPSASDWEVEEET